MFFGGVRELTRNELGIWSGWYCGSPPLSPGHSTANKNFFIDGNKPSL